MTRLALTDLDKQACDLLIDKAKKAKFDVSIDQIGNIFIRRQGKNSNLNPVLMGSHADSQPKGGRFDGVYGVLAGLEVMLSLNDNNVQTERSIDLAIWTNEEGTRFAPAMMGSAVFAKKMKLENALSCQDNNGVTVKEELERIGYAGSDDFSQYNPYASLELHIEQGPILEKHNNVIGIVTGSLGQKWYEIEFIGEASHAGTTPMNMRRDAGFGMARAMLKLHDLGMQECDMGGRITIGEVKLDPGSRNVIPGRAWFTLEIRHPNKQALEKMDKKIYDLMHHIGKTNKLDVLINKILSISPLNFDQKCISVVREVTRNLGYSHEDMISGAGHDSCYLNYVAPASMIFIPCVNGLSHNELEDITFEWSEAGAQVLAHSIVKLASHGFEI